MMEEHALKRTNKILIWLNLVAIIIYACGPSFINYLTNSREGSVAAWQFLSAVIGLCLFGYGLSEAHELKTVKASSIFMTTAWVSVAAGVLGFIFAFMPKSMALGIISSIVAAVAFVCAMMAHKQN